MNNVEESLVAYLLIHPEEVETISAEVKPEMLRMNFYRDCYKAITRGYSDPPSLFAVLQKRYENAEEKLGELIANYSYVSITSTIKAIQNRYRSQKLNQILEESNVDELTIEETLLKLKDSIESLIPTNNEGRIKFSQLGDKYKDDYFKPKPPRFETGIKSIDEKIKGADKGDMFVLAARPAIGKSALALQIIRHNKALKAGYFNLEMGESQIYERLVASMSGIDLGHLRMAERPLNDDYVKMNVANSALAEMENVELFTGSQTVSKIRKYCKDANFDFIVVDYLQLINPDNPRLGNRSAEVGDISRGLKAIATDFQMVVVALCQLNRVSERMTDREPTMSELRESGAIEQDASEIVMMWAHQEYNKRNIKVEKARNGVLGRTELIFEGRYMTFSESTYYKEETHNDFKEIEEDEDVPFD